MSSSAAFRVLDALGNSLQGRSYEIGDGGGRRSVRGITWQALLDSTRLSAEELTLSVSHLLERGLIGQGGPVEHPTQRPLDRHPLYVWVTEGGQEILHAAAREADEWI